MAVRRAHLLEPHDHRLRFVLGQIGRADQIIDLLRLKVRERLGEVCILRIGDVQIHRLGRVDVAEESARQVGAVFLAERFGDFAHTGQVVRARLRGVAHDHADIALVTHGDGDLRGGLECNINRRQSHVPYSSFVWLGCAPKATSVMSGCVTGAAGRSSS